MAGCGSTALIGPLGPNSKIQRHNARKASESAGKSVPTPCSTSAASIAVAGGAGDQLSFAVFLHYSLQFIRLSALKIQVTVHADSSATLWLLNVLEESWQKLELRLLFVLASAAPPSSVTGALFRFCESPRAHLGSGGLFTPQQTVRNTFSQLNFV